MKKVVVGLVSAAALATITAGMAAGTNSTVASQDFFNNSAAGIYVGGGLGFSHTNAGTLLSNDKNNFAFGFDAGYQVNQYLAAEFGYINVDRKSHESAYILDLVAKGILPVTDQISLFGKAGLARVAVSETQSGTTLTGSRYTGILGAGVSYNINNSLSVDAQVLHAFKTSSDGLNWPGITTTLVGLSYKFSAV